MCIVHKKEQSATLKKLFLDNDGPSYEIKSPCFLFDWICRLPFKEDHLREGEWVGHEYNQTMNFISAHRSYNGVYMCMGCVSCLDYAMECTLAPFVLNGAHPSFVCYQ